MDAALREPAWADGFEVRSRRRANPSALTRFVPPLRAWVGRARAVHAFSRRRLAAFRSSPAWIPFERPLGAGAPFALVLALGLGLGVWIGANLSNAFPSPDRPFGWPGASSFGNAVAMDRSMFVLAATVPGAITAFAMSHALLACAFYALGAFAAVLFLWHGMAAVAGVWLFYGVLFENDS